MSAEPTGSPEPGTSSYPVEAASDATNGPDDDTAPGAPPADPERGLRGVMSAILICEAVTILLGLTVIGNGGVHAPGWQVGVVSGLALAHLLAPAIIKRRYAIGVIWILQVLLLGCWAIHAAIGTMGIVFALVWLLVMYMRREFRRRTASVSKPGPPAGTIGGAP